MPRPVRRIHRSPTARRSSWCVRDGRRAALSTTLSCGGRERVSTDGARAATLVPRTSAQTRPTHGIPASTCLPISEVGVGPRGISGMQQPLKP
jgi:hypothetical protein